LTAAGASALSIFCGEAAEPDSVGRSCRAEQKVDKPNSQITMQKKQEGGFKPLWVKCSGCQKWNGVQPGAVLKYLDKLISPAAVKPVQEQTAKEGDE
jgi:hypothetical protein